MTSRKNRLVCYGQGGFAVMAQKIPGVYVLHIILQHFHLPRILFLILCPQEVHHQPVGIRFFSPTAG
jgi:hypothetical protein